MSLTGVSAIYGSHFCYLCYPCCSNFSLSFSCLKSTIQALVIILFQVAEGTAQLQQWSGDGPNAQQLHIDLAAKWKEINEALTEKLGRMVLDCERCESGALCHLFCVAPSLLPAPSLRCHCVVTAVTISTPSLASSLLSPSQIGAQTREVSSSRKQPTTKISCLGKRAFLCLCLPVPITCSLGCAVQPPSQSVNQSAVSLPASQPTWDRSV